ncbi:MULTISPECIES: hypothetical protein [Paenibacillus]|uniref:Uncharacterized protein n=1 Tax=Paenibacillus albilobatus TaxID=2716884 RepID=A0A919XGF3_9BACL|nr:MULTISPECIES: hypothetical protein [Paenibacillus]GIO32361.1 hypothetical protein J2TS6_35020 [Paenibacillus albilobatus]
MMLAAVLAVLLMCGFYFAVVYFGLRLLFKKVLHRTLDPMVLFAVLIILLSCLGIGQRIWYNQPWDAGMLLMPLSAMVVVLLRKMRARK